MKSRQHGTSGLTISALGYGGVGFDVGYANTVSRGQSIALIRAAVKRGVTFSDTVEIYGPKQ